MLRAYRLAALRGWRIERRTRIWLGRAAPGLLGTAPERVHDEIVRLFGAADPLPIAWAAADGALSSALRLPPGPAVARAARSLGARRKSDGAPAAVAIRLALLFHAAATGPDEAADRLDRLKFSRAEARAITRTLRFLASAFSDAPPLSVLFAHRAELPLLLRAADAAARGRAQRARVGALRSAARRVTPGEAPVDGRDLARWLDLTPGPELGRWLDRARFGWFSRQWRDRDQMKRALIARRFDPAKPVG